MITQLPKPHYTPRLPKVRAVTIALGFRCSDGIVLCADQQMTVQGWHKFRETKMYAIAGIEAPSYTVMLTYAGSPHAMKALHQKMASVTEQSYFDSVDSVKALLEGFLSEMQTEAESTEFLFGFCREGGSFGLLQTNACSVYQVNGYTNIGVGDSSLVRFLSKLLVSNSMKCFPAVFIGDYIIKQAKEFVDGCGGPTDIYILRGNGKFAPAGPRAIAKSSEAAEAIEHDIRSLLWLTANTEESERIEAFWNDLRQRAGAFLGREELKA